jgi:tRNA1Val (adenine37-N6)-methyltransferase
MIMDELWPGGPSFIRRDDAFRLGTDSVLLADFACAPGGHACDLGCGSGILSVLMAYREPALTVDGVELLPDWADTARDNVRLNRLDGRVRIVTGDLRRHREFLEAGAYDLVAANPPYYPAGSGKLPQNENSVTARSEQTCTLQDVCAAARYLTRWGGRFALVHKPERLAEIVRALSENDLEPKRMRFVQHRAGDAPNLVLIESRRGGNPSVTIEPPLILTDANGRDTEEVKRIYHRK